MNETDSLSELRFTVSGRVSRPCAEVYSAVADPEQLSHYFTTGGAHGRLEPGQEVTWDFHDFPGRFPVTVLEADPPHRIVIEWDARSSTRDDGKTRTTFEFEPLDDDTRTLVTSPKKPGAPPSTGRKRHSETAKAGPGCSRHSRRGWSTASTSGRVSTADDHHTAR